MVCFKHVGVVEILGWNSSSLVEVFSWLDLLMFLPVAGVVAKEFAPSLCFFW